MKSLEPISGRISALHIFIVALSMAMTLGAWLYSKRQVDIQVENRFNAARDRTIGLIVDRMSRYEDALWSGVATINAHDPGAMPYEEWRGFAGSLNIPERYPGVNGIGVIYYVDRSDYPAFRALRDREDRGFSIYPEHDQSFLLPITYIEPEDMNQAAIGLDVAHETNRRTALLASRDTGTAQITGPIFLVQDSGHTPGFLFYTPFYYGDEPTTLEERRDRFGGAVYSPFIVRNLVEGLLSKDLRQVRFSIRDGDKIIYDEHVQDDALRDDDPMFSESVTLDMYGREWIIDIRTNLAFRAENGSEQPMMILLGGVIIEILVISLLVLLVSSTRRAHQYADQLTQQLQNKNAKLELMNEEIEQFVYVASHDLKTPVRGIGFLADVLEEDLEDIIGPLEEHSDIRMQLNKIRERVSRINDLTSGIMEFSGIRNNKDAETALPLAALVEDCVADFKVAPSQIRLTTDVEAIECDTQNFRRVIENLIGNAFKHHPDHETAQVDLSIEDFGDRLKVIVKDNGNGIAPEFHDKIFNVFQTLRKAGDPLSTGIGLAIVKKAVHRHGYDIEVNSFPQEGTEFIFYWPNARSAEEATMKAVA